jgi:thioredoxin reductase/ferredoxin
VTALVLALFVAAALGLSQLWRARELRSSRRNHTLLDEIAASGVAIPDTVIPRIDPALCIGSGTCVKACPENDVIGVVDGVARLIAPSACVGHGECAAACPVGAIELVFGTREHAVAVPDLDPELQTNLPGVYIAGEAMGVSLIRNAVRLGRTVAERIAQSGRRGAGEVLDAVVIGAGPAGMSAALALQDRGLRVEVLERDVPLATLRGYPEGKLVLTGKLELAGRRPVRTASMPRERVLALFDSVVADAQLAIHSAASVSALQARGDGSWTVRSTRGTRHAANVIVAMGRRGAPRKLDAPGAERAKVLYGLCDASAGDGKHVLVVGGGNSAIESVFALLDRGRAASVALSYRRSRLSRLRGANSARLQAEVGCGRVRLLLATEVARVDLGSVTVRYASGQELAIVNDLVVAQLGGLSPVAELQRFGIRVIEKRGER